MIPRAAKDDLNRWYSHAHRKPLILRGARQVGKSTLVREFARDLGVVLWEVNLEKNTQLNDVFRTLNIDLILQEISILLNVPGVGKGPGVLFLDEIQAVPMALASLRYFFEERADLAVIAAGSLLEFTLTEAEFSMPVGRTEYYWLGPVSFEEYLIGCGEGPALDVWRTWKPGDFFPESAHRRLSQRLREFLLVGGMPEAVQVYLDSGDFMEAVKVHSSLLETYRDDFSKYAQGAELEKLRRVFEVVPGILGRKIIYRQFHPDWRAKDIRHCIELLIRAGLIIPVIHFHAGGQPLGAEEDPRVYKLFFLDVGTAGTANGAGQLSLEHFRSGRFINEGSIAEQFTAQEMLSGLPRSQRSKLHYWLREGKSNNAEVDFLCSSGTRVLPVEVKSGSSGSLRSLHQFMVRNSNGAAFRLDMNPPSVQKVDTEIQTGSGKTGVSYRLFNLPLYLAGRLYEISSEID